MSSVHVHRICTESLHCCFVEFSVINFALCSANAKSSIQAPNHWLHFQKGFSVKYELFSYMILFFHMHVHFVGCFLLITKALNPLYMANLLCSAFDFTRELKSTFKTGTVLVVNQMIVFAKYSF